MFDAIKKRDLNNLLFQIVIKAYSPNHKDQKEALDGLWAFPEIQNSMISIYKKITNTDLVQRVSTKTLSGEKLQNNVTAMRMALSMFINNVSANSFSCITIQKIYNYGADFELSTIIHRENDKELSVSDLLEIISYATECAKQFCNIDTSNVENGLLVLKTVNFALKNQSHERPMLESTHLAVDILSALLQNFESAPEAKKRISGGATMVKLAISFFTGK